mgnify:FL=1
MVDINALRDLLRKANSSTGTGKKGGNTAQYRRKRRKKKKIDPLKEATRKFLMPETHLRPHTTGVTGLRRRAERPGGHRGTLSFGSGSITPGLLSKSRGPSLPGLSVVASTIFEEDSQLPDFLMSHGPSLDEIEDDIEQQESASNSFGDSSEPIAAPESRSPRYSLANSIPRRSPRRVQQAFEEHQTSPTTRASPKKKSLYLAQTANGWRIVDPAPVARFESAVLEKNVQPVASRAKVNKRSPRKLRIPERLSPQRSGGSHASSQPSHHARKAGPFQSVTSNAPFDPVTASQGTSHAAAKSLYRSTGKHSKAAGRLRNAVANARQNKAPKRISLFQRSKMISEKAKAMIRKKKKAKAREEKRRRRHEAKVSQQLKALWCREVHFSSCDRCVFRSV